jgi:hypothetical protein
MGWLTRWFGSRDALDIPSRLWIRKHLWWLGDQFGEDRLIEQPIVEPTDKFFPDKYGGSPAAIKPLFNRVCAYMDVDPETVQLELFSNDKSLGLVTADGFQIGVAAGTFQGGQRGHCIKLDQQHLEKPGNAVAILAHELAHVRLLGEGRVDPDRFDHELLTDLCAVFFGFGIFTANQPAHNVPSDATWPGTGLWCPSYMTLPMHAFALALIAQVRFEENPKWARYLKPSAAAAFKAASRWLAAEAERPST